MTEILRPDLCVIGGGPGGIAAARVAADAGAEVVLVEKRPLGGYEHLQSAWHVQSLINTALRSAISRGAARFGAPEAELRIDFKRLRRESEIAMRRFLKDDAPARLKGLNIRIIQATGQFTSPSRFEAGDVAIDARNFLLAVGSFASAPGIPGVELVRPLTADRLLDLPVVPKRLAIIGANSDHLALAQAFARLGAKVILIEPGAFLEAEDPELTAPIFDALRLDGVDIIDKAAIRKVELAGTNPGAGLRLILADASVEASHLLYAPEYLPLTEGLGLKQARVDYDKGGPKLKSGLTSNPKIYALRDGVESLRSIRLARGDGERLARTILGQPVREPTLARIICTDPELAVVGLSEAAARAERRAIHVLRASFCDNLRAVSGPQSGRQPAAGQPTAGHVKIITNSTGHLLGAGIVGPQARELIGVFSLALAKGLTVGDLAEIAVDEPTLMEVCRAAALAPQPQKGKVGSGFRHKRFS